MQRPLSVLFAIVGWFAIIVQLILMLDNRTASVAETLIRFFSFFTILTNTLVAVYFTLKVFKTKEDSSGVLHKPGSLTAITMYITVVGLVYQVALRHIWHPTGLQMVVDELLHTVIPLLVIIYWAMYEQKSQVAWKNIPKFLWYPALYLAFILIRGEFSGFYPYPFIRVSELGWATTLVNILVLFGVFLVLSFLFVGIGKWIGKQMS